MVVVSRQGKWFVLVALEIGANGCIDPWPVEVQPYFACVARRARNRFRLAVDLITPHQPGCEKQEKCSRSGDVPRPPPLSARMVWLTRCRWQFRAPAVKP